MRNDNDIRGSNYRYRPDIANPHRYIEHTWQSHAQELWGERWKSTLALTAGVTKRTVQRWNAGAEPNKEVLQKLEETYNIWVLCQAEDRHQ